MTRITSAATTISLQAPGVTALEIAARESTATFPYNSFKAFLGDDFLITTTHPVTGVVVEFTEDGAGAANTAIDWAGKGCYDSKAKRVMWMSTGQGINGTAGTYVRHTHAIYDENDSSNGTRQGRWSANRAFQPPGLSTVAVGHMYDSQCIDVTGRRFYKASFNENKIAVCDLDSLAWIASFDGPPQDYYLRTGALEFIPTRGSNGALWCYGQSLNVRTIWEKQLPNGSWTVVASGMGSYAEACMPMSYNPRTNKVLCGNNAAAAYIVDCSTLAVTATAAPPTTMDGNHYMHMCKEPPRVGLPNTGRGWIYFAVNGRYYQCSESGAWTDLGASPGALAQPPGRGFPNCVQVPLDEYGVIWIVTAKYGTTGSRAWLYKP